MTIAITGAAGKTGRAIVEALARRAAHSRALVRALVHREEHRARLLEEGASEVVIADLTDRSALERAFAGSTAVYHICPNMRPDEVEIGERVIAACHEAGVQRLVYHSVLHPQIEAMPHHWKKLRVEERLLESGLDVTILQPAAYMQNIKAQWGRIVNEGVYEVPYAPATRLAMVDLREVADAAAVVLTEAGHDNGIYELCGPEVLSQDEVARVLSESLGRPVDLSVVDRADWARQARAAGLAPYAVGTLVSMFEHYERYGFSGSSRILEWLLGRPPATLGEVVDRWIG